MEIGARLFAERPFNDVWIEEVAKAAGVSRGLVYHYFPNKRDFYSAIVRHGMRSAFELTAPDPDLPPDQWITAGIENLLDYVEQNADAFRAVYSGRHSVDDDVREALKEGRNAQIDRMCEYLSPEEPPTVTLRLAIEAWIALLDTMMLQWIDGHQIERAKLVQVASGSLVGTVAAAFVADGNIDRLAGLRHLAPDDFKRV